MASQVNPMCPALRQWFPGWVPGRLQDKWGAASNLGGKVLLWALAWAGALLFLGLGPGLHAQHYCTSLSGSATPLGRGGLPQGLTLCKSKEQAARALATAGATAPRFPFAVSWGGSCLQVRRQPGTPEGLALRTEAWDCGDAKCSSFGHTEK